MVDEGLQRLAHRPELRRPDVVDSGPLAGGGPKARVGEVGGVDELVAVVSRAEDVHGRTVGDELEQHAEDPEATVAEDRPGPDDGHVEAGGDRFETQHLGLELGTPVRLEMPARGLLGYSIARMY